MKLLIKKLLRENLDKKIMFFLRWTNSPDDDMKRNFSGHMQAWFDSEEEAYFDYEERKNDGYHIESLPKKDPVNGMWNSDPEWGLSGYGFNNEKSYLIAMKEITEIAWHHKEANGQDLVVFASSNYSLGEGFDGEDTFKDVINFWYINDGMNYNQVISIINEKSN